MPPPKFVSRAEWGAKPPRSVSKRPPSQLSGVAVHWFGSPRAAASHDGCSALLRSVQSTHMAPGGLGTKGGAADIAYNHAVCPHGHAFTLRGFGVQTGANGDATSNRDFAAVVYMGGKGDAPTPEGLVTLGAVIREWQAKGAGPLVKPHGFFTGSECPGPDIVKWLKVMPSPWLDSGRTTASVAVQDETPDWLLDFVVWRLVQGGALAKRPKGVPDPVPDSAWEATARMERMANAMGPQQSFLDWAEWRRQGAKKDDRPRSLPAKIPDPWWDALKRLEAIFRGEKTMDSGGDGEADTEAKPKPEVEAEKTVTDTGPVTADSALLSEPRATLKTLEAHSLGRKHGGYKPAEVKKILKTYVDTCGTVGLDPLLVVTQMVLETGNLTSDWSQPPKHNPAGIGVTGEPGKGVKFPSWDEAVRAHVGRLLAYALPKPKGTAAQKKLIAEALEWRALPDNRRGVAPTLAGLAGTWAMDPKYAEKLVRVANEIRAAG